MALAPAGDSYQLTLRLTRSGDGADNRSAPFPVYLNTHALVSLTNDPEVYGVTLRDMLFTDAAANHFRMMRAAAINDRTLLRVRLLLPPELHSLRWETLLDPETGRALAQDSHLLLSRYLSADDYIPVGLRPKGQMRALIAVAAPSDYAAYRLAEIKAAVETAPIQTALAHLQPTTITATWEALSDALREGYDLVYLVAHGSLHTDQPWLYLVDESGNADRRSGKALSELIRGLDVRRPRLVVLASCASAGDGYANMLATLGPQLAQAGIPAVLAMQGNIQIATLATFAPVLFTELLIDGAIERAVNMARLAVAEQPDWWMPVLYTRLDEGRIWADHPATDDPTSIRIIPPKPPMLIGRDSDLAKLKQRVGVGQTRQQRASVKVLTAMRGWPGVGKTTLAAALANDEEITARFPDGVLWAALGQQPNIFAELGSWGRALGIPDLYGAKTAEEASRVLAGILRHKRTLLIVDDVWEEAHLQPFRIGGDDCALLLTTRLPEVARALATTPDDVYVLGVLDPEDALLLLQTLAPDIVAANEAACRELVVDLEGLPLALQVAGRLLQEEAAYGFGITDLLRALRDGTQIITAKAPADRADLANQTTPTVAALLELSTRRLDEQALIHFAYLGVFAPKPATFDLAAIRSVWNLDDPQPLLRNTNYD